MQVISNILPYLQIGVSVLLVITILMQQSGAGLGGALGGMNEGTTYHKKRGAEKFFFVTTIVLGIIFAILAVVSLLVR